MGFPIKTSDINWLDKASLKFNKRISISIIDDANYNLNIGSDIIKMFSRFTLSIKSIAFLCVFYVLAVVCMIMLYLSFSLQYSRYLGIGLSAIFLIVCIGLPTYYLAKNNSPKIEKTEQGVDIIFSNKF
jgi:hypothetical protein